jgi:hypothetical protein
MAASGSLLNLHNAIEIVNPYSIQNYLILSFWPVQNLSEGFPSRGNDNKRSILSTLRYLLQDDSLRIDAYLLDSLFFQGVIMEIFSAFRPLPLARVSKITGDAARQWYK